MRNIIKSLSVFAILFILKATSFGAYFYLSTEKSFLDSENARVKIESQSTPAVTVRLYKVGNPEAFIRSRKNINRVYIESEYIKNNPAQLLFDYANIFKRSLKEYGRDRVQNIDTRKNAVNNFYDFLSPSEAKKQIVVGKIKDYEFVREFGQKLDEGSTWTYSYIDFGKLKNGLYLTEVFSGNSIAYTLIHVSKLGLIIKKSETGLLAQTLDKKTGAGVKADIKITDFENGKELVSGKSADTGLYQYGFPKNKYSEVLVFARNGDDFTFFKVSYYPVAETERLVYLYTDSPIYKSGSTVKIKGILRDYKNSLYAVPNVKKVKMTVYDPRGNTAELGESSVGDYGSFEASFDVNDKSPTGIYKIAATVNDRTYAGEFRVENYVKPKFSVTVVPDKSVVVGSQTVKFKIKAAYFTGNRVADAEVKYSIFKTPVSEDIFEGEKDIFEDPSYASRIEFLDSRTATLNRNGEFEVSFSPSMYNIDRDYAFIVKAEVKDKAQSRAAGSGKVKVVKAEFFVKTEIGKSVYTGDEEVSAVVRLSYPDGTPVQNKTLSYQAVLEDGGQTLSKGDVTTDRRGYAEIKFKAGGKGFLKIAVSTRDSFNNAVNDNVFTWIGQDGGTFVYTSGDITIVFDKDEYRVGDKARVLIVSPVAYAKALVAKERETVFDYSVQNFKGNTMLLTVPIEKQYTPNFFFTTTFIFNNQVYENTVKVKVPPADKMLKLAVTTDKKNYSPQDKGKIRVTVTDSEGRPVAAELSVSVVDEALYKISPEVFPDIRLFFYSYRWNSVTTLNSIALRFYGYSRELKEKYAMKYYKKKVWDFDDFMNRATGEYTGMKESSDQSVKEEEAQRRVFKDQILWQGSVRTDKKGGAEIPVQFPDNLTQWRITAVAITKDTRVGKTKASVKTIKEFFVSLNMPENVTYVDKANAYITIVNNTDKSQKVKLKVLSEKLKTVLSTNTVVVPASSQKSVPFSVNPDKIGSFKVKVFAQGTDKTDSMEQVLNVTPVSLKKVYSDVRMIQGANDKLSFKIPASAIRETIQATVGLSQMDSPFGVVAEALPFLKSYPYGCVEQTTSSFLPNLVAFLAAKKLKIDLPAVFSDKFAILDKGLQALYGFQNADGTWGWWNEGQTDIYMTAYVLYAMNFVKRTFPDKLNTEIYDKGVRALDSALKARAGDENSQIYGYYVLSECGTIYKDMVQRMVKNPPADAYALSLLIMTAVNSGLGKTAQDLTKKLEEMAKSEMYYSWWGKDNDADYWYGADIIVTSAALRALMSAGVSSPNIDRAIAYLLLKRNGNIWQSTHDTAEAVYAIADYVEGGYAKPNTQSVDVLLDNKKISTFTFQNNNFRNSFRIPVEMLPAGSMHRVTFNLKSGNYFGDLRLEYNDREIAVESEDNGIAVSRTYYRVVNNSKVEPIEGNTVLKAGDVLLVELSADMKSGNGLDYVVLEDGIPAGFLPVFGVNEYNLGIDFYKDTSHVEFGRGLASFFFKTFRPGKYHYLIQATYPGMFYALPALGYAMYRPDKRGNSVSTLFEVTE